MPVMPRATIIFHDIYSTIGRDERAIASLANTSTNKQGYVTSASYPGVRSSPDVYDVYIAVPSLLVLK